MISEVPVHMEKMIDWLLFVDQVHTILALSNTNEMRMLAFSYGYIFRLKAIVYDVCMVITGIVIHKHKFCAHGTLNKWTCCSEWCLEKFGLLWFQFQHTDLIWSPVWFTSKWEILYYRNLRRSIVFSPW